MKLKPETSIAFGTGVVAGLGQSLVLGLARILDFTPFSMELTLGSLFSRQLGTGSWILGFLVHLLVSGGIGVLYSYAFRALERSGWGAGIGVAIPHWGFTGFFLGLLPYFHPVIPGLLPVPGYLGANLGPGTFFSVMLSVLVYGAVVGTLQRPTGDSKLVGRIDEGLELRSSTLQRTA